MGCALAGVGTLSLGVVVVVMTVGAGGSASGVGGDKVVLVWMGAGAEGWAVAGICVGGAGGWGMRRGQTALKWPIPPQRVQAPAALLS